MRGIIPSLLLVAALAAWLPAVTGSAQPALTAEQLFNQGHSAMERGNHDLAIDFYKRCVAAKPEYKQAWYNLGYTYSFKAMYDEEIDAYEHAIAIDPRYLKALTGLMMAHGDRGEHDHALAYARQALALDEKAFNAWFRMGWSLYNVAQDQPTVDQKMAMLEQACTAYQKHLATEPNDHKGLYNMGMALEEQGKIEEAKQAYIKSITIEPNYLKALYNVAYMYELQGEPAAELATWKHYLELAKDDPSKAAFVEYGRTRVATLESTAP